MLGVHWFDVESNVVFPEHCVSSTLVTDGFDSGAGSITPSPSPSSSSSTSPSIP
jgi:hypothetical protein